MQDLGPKARTSRSAASQQAASGRSADGQQTAGRQPPGGQQTHKQRSTHTVSSPSAGGQQSVSRWSAGGQQVVRTQRAQGRSHCRPLFVPYLCRHGRVRPVVRLERPRAVPVTDYRSTTRERPSIRLRLAPRTCDAPPMCVYSGPSARVVSQTKSRKYPPRKCTLLFFKTRARG